MSSIEQSEKGMKFKMGESIEENNLFFTCSLIEYIARKTKNTKKYVVEKLGYDNIKKIYELAEVYHCENIDKVSDEFIETSRIEVGSYDVLANVKYRIPTYFEIGRIYKRLIVRVNSDNNKYIETLEDVMKSWIIEKIDNYNSSMYYENPEYIYQCYIEEEII